MTPEQAAYLFRELLQTPLTELGRFAQRMGLASQPSAVALEKAQELLVTIAAALEQSGGVGWERVESAWAGARFSRGEHVGGDVARAPEWVRELPQAPRLDDPAPGTSNWEEQQKKRARFVPRAAAPPPTRGRVPPARGAVAGLAMPHAHGSPLPSAQAQFGQSEGAQAPGYGESYAPGSPPPPPAVGVQPGTMKEAPRARPLGDHGYPAAPPYLDAHRMGQRAASEPIAIHHDGEWSVSRYAAFCAACSAYPERVVDTQREYGLAGHDARRALDDHFSARFDNEPELAGQWERMFAQFRGQLATR